MNEQTPQNTRPTSIDGREPRRRWLAWPLVASTLLISVQAWTGHPDQDRGSVSDGGLNPTAHPAVPATLEAMWYARATDNAPTPPAIANLARGVALLDTDGSAADALPLVSDSALAHTDVAEYARYYTGLALSRLNRLEEAEIEFAEVADSKHVSQLREAAAYRHAEILTARMDFKGAADIYDDMLDKKLASPQIALVKFGAVSSAAGDRDKAIKAHRRVLKEFPLSAEAAEAEQLLEGLGGLMLDDSDDVKDELARAEALFKAKRWAPARDAFGRVRDKVKEKDRDRVTLRIAQIQAANGQPRAAREIFRRFTAHPELAAEAQHGIVTTTRLLGEDEFKQLTSDFVARHPKHPLAEDALNELARYYVLKDDDGRAAEIYTQMVAAFPAGPLAERAIWKAGWWAYRTRNYRETVRLFEHGPTTFARSDFRPSWLYWSARAYDQVGDSASATGRYKLAATDYLNTYYGRLAWKQLEQRNDTNVTPGARRAIVTPPPPAPNADRIARLIDVGLYRPALNELQYAQKMWGDSVPLQATIALVHNKMGNLRMGITAMKRAYPQFMTAGGETLPEDILRVIYPIDYWPLLKGNAEAQGVDPYIIVALAGQESTFDATIHSPADAVGLMQIMPATGRQLAREVGMNNFSVKSLENAEINARLGTKYYADLVRRYGGHHFALAGYNAGGHRVNKWKADAPGVPQDEWVDNIPFFETQNYVKRILGTAEDYRRLYGDGQLPTAVARPAPRATSNAVVKKAPAKKKPTLKKGSAKKKPTLKKATPKKRAPANKRTPRKATTRRR
ncbi:MAG TPA: transglycosylase SLT domain-containing protein [Vicinamibacterales bacterium]|nr:transglycosylase SLT domain-containing protein [Vicinamibacterales bacterium]